MFRVVHADGEVESFMRMPLENVAEVCRHTASMICIDFRETCAIICGSVHPKCKYHRWFSSYQGDVAIVDSDEVLFVVQTSMVPPEYSMASEAMICTVGVLTTDYLYVPRFQDELQFGDNRLHDPSWLYFPGAASVFTISKSVAQR